ncbi:hypothetical protein LCGC14_2908480, partial [marine sediment metagenome]
MEKLHEKLEKLTENLKIIKEDVLTHIKELHSSIHIYTHLDADGLSSGAILGKCFLRENLPFQITTLRQLEKVEIAKISEKING